MCCDTTVAQASDRDGPRPSLAWQAQRAANPPPAHDHPLLTHTTRVPLQPGECRR